MNRTWQIRPYRAGGATGILQLRVKDRLIGRDLDVIRVQGKQEPVSIYQIMGRITDPSVFDEPLGIYRKALAFYSVFDRSIKKRVTAFSYNPLFFLEQASGLEPLTC